VIRRARRECSGVMSKQFREGHEFHWCQISPRKSRALAAEARSSHSGSPKSRFPFGSLRSTVGHSGQALSSSLGMTGGIKNVGQECPFGSAQGRLLRLRSGQAPSAWLRTGSFGLAQDRPSHTDTTHAGTLQDSPFDSAQDSRGLSPHDSWFGQRPTTNGQPRALRAECQVLNAKC
jgi:hypothetical protein